MFSFVSVMMKYIFFITLFLAHSLFSQENMAISAHVIPSFENQSIEGKIDFVFDVPQMLDSVYLDTKNMDIKNVTLNGKPIDYSYNQKHIVVKYKFKKKHNSLKFEYNCQPKQTVYFTEYFDQKQIWTQGQGKETSHWLPSFDDVNKKIVFDISIKYHKDYQVISNGLLKEIHQLENQTEWHYAMTEPISSYLMMMAIGQYVKQSDTTNSGTWLEFYLPENDSTKFETTFKHTKELFEFLETTLQVAYPWNVYRQIPVYDFLYSGMENTTSTIFSQDFVVDNIGVNDIQYVNVNAHELAHQWFGNLVTAKTNKDHWIQEGFATFYALQVEKHLFGEQYFFDEIYRLANIMLSVSHDDELLLYAEHQSSVTYYYKGAWMLLALEHTIGKNNFDTVVKTFLEQYQYKNATTNDFFELLATIVNIDLSEFEDVWLYQKGVPVNNIVAVLNEYPYFELYNQVISLHKIPYHSKKAQLHELWQKNNKWINIEILKQIAHENNDIKNDWITKALNQKDVSIQQMALNLIETDFEGLQPLLELLLINSSYINSEIVLKLLCELYPDNQLLYLEATKDIRGLNDFNIRIVWLSIALKSDRVEHSLKLQYYDELLAYTSEKYPSNIRQNAMEQMLYLNANDTSIHKALAMGLVHHKWQFTKYCKDKIREQMTSKTKKAFYESILNELPEKNQRSLKAIIKEFE